MATQLAKTKNHLSQTLWSIAETDNVHELDSVLSNYNDINAKNAHGTTALMLAAANGRLRMVRALLAHGADPNSSRNDKFTPLLLAAFFGHEQIVKTLVEHGADTSAATRFGTSAQMWASSRTFAEVVVYLNGGPSAIPTDRIEQEPNIDQARKDEPRDASTKPTRDWVKRPAHRFVLETDAKEQKYVKYVPSRWMRFREVLHQNVAAYPVLTLIVVAVVIVGLSIQQKLLSDEVTSQMRPSVLIEQSAIPVDGTSQLSPSIGTKNAPTNVFTTTTSAAPIVPVVNSGSEKALSSSDASKANQKSKAKTDVRVIAASDFVPPTEPVLNNTRPPVAPSQTPTDARKSDANAVKNEPATVVQTTPPKPQASVSEPRTAKRSAPLSSELITPAKNSAPKGKVIQWP